MFKSNYLATQQSRSVRYNAIQSTFIGIPFGGVLIFLMYFANKGREKTQILISMTVVPFAVALIVFIGFMIRLMIKRWNRTINTINFESGKVTLETFPVFWYKPKRYVVSAPELIIKKTTFPWYGKDKKEGLVVKVNNQNELYLVGDYFDDYEVILNSLYQKS